MSLPKIVKTIFHVDSSHGRDYNFDVNHNITMSELKGILVAAANVNRLGLRVFDKFTEEELTHYNEETLQSLYPKKDVVEFIIQIDRSYKLTLQHEQLKLGNTCQEHPVKYLIFYCFDCAKSLCSLCVSTQNHHNHCMSEKFDYLKPSKEIVGNLFSELDDIVEKVASSNNPDDIENFKVKLKMKYFPSLIDLLKVIETRITEQIDSFNKHCSISISTVKDNSVKLKEHCVEGLNELKYQLDIENMLRDEGIFLHFDYKVKEMTNEKQRILNDTEKLDKIIKSFAYIKKKLETVYSEIKVFLESYLSINIYSDVNKLTEGVEKISKESIMNKLLTDFKKQNGRIVSEAKNKNLRYSNVSSNSNINNSYVSNNLGSTKFNLNDTFHQQFNSYNIVNFNTLPNANNITDKYLLNNEKYNDANKDKDKDMDNTKNDYDNEANPLAKTTYNTVESKNRSQSKKDNLNDIITIKDMDIKDSGVKDNISDHSILLKLDKNTKIENLNWIIKVNENENKLVVYVDSPNSNNKQKVFDQVVKFNPTIHGISAFLKNTATVNTGKLLYISGGEISPLVSSDLFFVYNPILSSLQRRDNMIMPKHSHSLAFSNDFVFSVGGYKSNTCERFDVKTGKWTRLSNLNCEERSRPVLYVHNAFLYCFFGYSAGKYMSSVERLSIKSSKSKWEVVLYNNSSSIDLGMIGCGIIPAKNDSIYIIGGKNADILSSVIMFDFKSTTFTLEQFSLDEPSYFKESNFIKFNDGDHGLFNEQLNQLLKLDLS